MRIFITLLLILLLSASAVVFYAWKDYSAPNELSQETTVILPRGSGFSKTVDILAENKIIAHPLIVKFIAYITKDGLHFKAGEYLFPPAISPQEVVRMLVAGQVVIHKVTIAEGLNVREVVALLNAEPILSGDVPAHIDEGTLFPETYHFTYGDTKASIIARMQEKMQQTLAVLWEKRDVNSPLKNRQEALILASIVEKETGLPAERSRVAAVFINRLKRGMKLQSDPTVVYGIEQATGKQLGRPLLSADLRTPTPYNTYEIPALPPAPIANPSREAIEATLRPMQTDELYFVATGNGGHNFASTLEQHNRNVREYRERIKQ